jgi:cell division transport system permease protein
MLLSTATTLMMGLILFILNVILVLNVLAQSSLQELAQKIDLIVYLTDEADVYQVNQMVNELNKQPEVLSVTYTSKDDALKQFLNLYPDQADPFSQYGISNPLPGNLQVVTQSPEDHDLILTYLQNSPYSNLLLDSESAGENQEIASRLLSLTRFTQKLIFGVILTFVFGSVLMVMNAIHLSIYTRKTEIQIMQLVGARPSMIYAPFLLEGAIYAVLAVVVSLFFLLIFLKSTELASYLSWTSSINPFWLLLVEVVGSITVGMLASIFATRTYLKRSLLLDQA